MKAVTSGLEGAALDWAVAMATEAWKWAHSLHPTMTLDPSFEGVCVRPYPRGEFGSSLDTCILLPRNPMRQDPSPFCPSSEWSHGGPMLDAHCKGFGLVLDERAKTWRAFGYGDPAGDGIHRFQRIAAGQTILIAACRAIVAAKLGDEIDIPEGIIQ